jgi:PQQ-dependent catabolism-associated beta-propeller protein
MRVRSTEWLAIGLLAVVPALHAETAWVSDEQANVVHVIDGATRRAVATIAVGRRPRGMAIDRDGKRLYVAVGNDNRIDVIDVPSRKVVDHLPSGPDPERFALSPDGRWLYVANEDDSAVSFVDIAGRRIAHTVAVGAEPEGMAVSPDGHWVICTSESASLVHFIDAATARLVDSVPVGTRPRDAAFSADGRQLWVSSETRATVAVFSMPDRRPLATIDFDDDPRAPETVQAVGIALGAARTFVALGRGNAVAEVDPRTFAIRRYFPVGQRNWGIAVAPDGRQLYAANGLSGDLTVIDLAGNRTLATLALGGKPWGVVVTP